MRNVPAALAGVLFLTVAAARAESSSIGDQAGDVTEFGLRPDSTAGGVHLRTSNFQGGSHSFNLPRVRYQSGSDTTSSRPLGSDNGDPTKGNAVDAASAERGQAFGALSSNGVIREPGLMLLLGTGLLFLGAVVRRRLTRKSQ